MLGTLDIREVTPQSGDHAALRAYMQLLVGQPFLLLRFSYGEELILHFGQPRDAPSRRTKPTIKGSYIVAARASSWFLRAEGPPTLFLGTGEAGPVPRAGFVPLTTHQVESSAPIRPGSRVVAAEPISIRGPEANGIGFGSSFALSDGSSLVIIPGPAEVSDGADEGEEVADWEVFTPYGRYLRVGPGAKWSYLPSVVENAPDATS